MPTAPCRVGCYCSRSRDHASASPSPTRHLSRWQRHGRWGRQMRTEILAQRPRAGRHASNDRRGSTGVASHSCYQTGLYNCRHHTACYLVNCLALLARSLGPVLRWPRRPQRISGPLCCSWKPVRPNPSSTRPAKAFDHRAGPAAGHGARIGTDGDFAEYPREAMSSLEAGGAYLDETPFGPKREHTRFVVADLQQGY
jgi:hypothetical protein